MVLPALILSTLDAGILIILQKRRLMMINDLLEHGGLPHVLPLAVHLIFLGSQVEGTILSRFCCGAPPSCLKVYGWVVCGLEEFSVIPRPLWTLNLTGLGLWLGLGGLGPGLDNFRI